MIVALVLFWASIIVAFIGGIIALAMPCCFSVLLPSYFASSFKRRIAILRMTLVFAAGIATVLLPIALGASTLAQYIGSGHSIIFTAGGFLMVFLGLWSLWGRSMFPQIHLPVNLQRRDTPSVYTLGVFSGVASSCCAPVLAGIAVLTALSASVFEALFVGLAYVFGMVFPLLTTALVWDRKAQPTSSFLRGRMVRATILGREFEMHSSNLIAGLMFVVMGAVTVLLGVTDTMIPTPGSEFLGIYQTYLEQVITNALSSTGVILALSVSFIVGLSVVVAVVLRRRRYGASQTLQEEQRDKE